MFKPVLFPHSLLVHLISSISCAPVPVPLSLCFPSIPDLCLVVFCFLSSVFVLHWSFSFACLFVARFCCLLFYCSHFRIFGFRLQCYGSPFVLLSSCLYVCPECGSIFVKTWQKYLFCSQETRLEWSRCLVINVRFCLHEHDWKSPQGLLKMSSSTNVEPLCFLIYIIKCFHTYKC